MEPSVIVCILPEANVSSACFSWENVPWVSVSPGGLCVSLGLRGTLLWAKLSVLANLGVMATGLCGDRDSGVSWS